MKLYSVIAVTLAATVTLSGCGEKKIEPNNYYCTGSFHGGKYDREELEELARKGQIDNVEDFLEQCRLKKLGSNSEALIKATSDAIKCQHNSFDLSPEEKVENEKCRNAPKALIEKWKKEAEQM
ncbi:hypothetical protein [Succinivibrio sp.]|uniref:hypothetical protein n=1 Tax=Succinivibrio sp. TaxID=2053619 RepID=UPI0038680CE4